MQRQSCHRLSPCDLGPRHLQSHPMQRHKEAHPLLASRQTSSTCVRSEQSSLQPSCLRVNSTLRDRQHPRRAPFHRLTLTRTLIGQAPVASCSVATIHRHHRLRLRNRLDLGSNLLSIQPLAPHSRRSSFPRIMPIIRQNRTCSSACSIKVMARQICHGVYAKAILRRCRSLRPFNLMLTNSSGIRPVKSSRLLQHSSKMVITSGRGLRHGHLRPPLKLRETYDPPPPIVRMA